MIENVVTVSAGRCNSSRQLREGEDLGSNQDGCIEVFTAHCPQCSSPTRVVQYWTSRKYSCVWQSFSLTSTCVAYHRNAFTRHHGSRAALFVPVAQMRWPFMTVGFVRLDVGAMVLSGLKCGGSQASKRSPFQRRAVQNAHVCSTTLHHAHECVLGDRCPPLMRGKEKGLPTGKLPVNCGAGDRMLQ